MKGDDEFVGCRQIGELGMKGFEHWVTIAVVENWVDNWMDRQCWDSVAKGSSQQTTLLCLSQVINKVNREDLIVEHPLVVRPPHLDYC